MQSQRSLQLSQVLNYIDQHLDEQLSLDALSQWAALSPYHFRRQFRAKFGLSPKRYIQLARLKRAAYHLAFRQFPVLQLALESGYQGPEAFSKIFKQTMGQNPSEFRRKPAWESLATAYVNLENARKKQLKSNLQNSRYQVDVVDFPQTRVAVLEHEGSTATLGDSIKRFIAWRKRVGLSPSVSATFNVFYPPAPGNQLRMDLCAAHAGLKEILDPEIVEKTIPAGRCAMIHHLGSDDLIGEILNHLLVNWLPASGEEKGDFPPFLQRLRFFPDVAEHEAEVRIFLPLR